MQRYKPIYDDPEGNLPAMEEDSDAGEYYRVEDVDKRIDVLRAALLSCVTVVSMQRDFHKVASDAIAEANKALMVTGAGK